MQHYDILIATPGAMMEAQYVKSLVNTLTECDKRKLTYKFLNAYGSLVHHARELTTTVGSGFQLNPNNKGPLEEIVKDYADSLRNAINMIKNNEFDPSEQIKDISLYRKKDKIIQKWLDFDKSLA